MVLPCKKLTTHVNTRFPYQIRSFQYILENKGATNCLYGLMGNIPDRIRKQKPYLMDWSVTSTILVTMRQIVGTIVKNQASSGQWKIFEAIVDTIDGNYPFYITTK